MRLARVFVCLFTWLRQITSSKCNFAIVMSLQSDKRYIENGIDYTPKIITPPDSLSIFRGNRNACRLVCISQNFDSKFVNKFSVDKF